MNRGQHMNRKQNQEQPTEAMHRDGAIYVIDGSPQHAEARAEGREFIVLCPDEPVPEKPIL